jgi:hypothetical protein
MTLGGTSWIKLGANSAMVFPFNHRSDQKRVDSPFPTIKSTAVSTFLGTSIGSPAQGLVGSVFWEKKLQGYSMH